ncbi:hypothetical protein QQS21_012605 [Conoideocrella luteorostrata]|uniref:Non-reducing end beta-L-arabinofuranosidase-like GH127 middle domain-containing protein n=1 Tax=Conoideocrella luteorostrata TaxID=1105319 RepID=A0AAJ0CDQ4_9HYPO|nr:hypothetical protein QQS21_012605 [Conoideocrella luteorostrata]
MANGLFGHEHEFYIYVNESSWLNKPGTGGAEYSNLNEALPYWFNSIVPMAYTLDDQRLKAQVQTVAKTVLGHQDADGWIGPEVGESRNFWARAPLFLGLIQLAEADNQWEKPVLDGLQRFMSLANKMLKNNSQGFVSCGGGVDCSWGQARIQDLIITIQWLLDHHPSGQDSLLWETMDLFHAQNPIKWDDWYTESTYPKIVNPDESPFAYIHGVNVGQGLKAPSVIYRINGSNTLAQKSHDAVDWTFKYHGSASGTVLADEKETGLAPFAGSELCTAVETSYSLAYLYQVLGSNDFADRAERTIFNAFPVMMTGDKWAHKYMDQPNQPWAINTTKGDGATPPIFTTANSGVATTLGMEPQYPCCTVNHGQGYPKFISNSWVRVGDRGIGHALLGPSGVETMVNGSVVSITCDTSYPFDSTLTYTIDAKSDFDFYVRVPEWATGYVIEAVPSASSTESATTTTTNSGSEKGMQKMTLKAGNIKVTYNIGTDIRTEARSNNTVAVFYGNMLYALEVGFSQTSSYPHTYYDPKGPELIGLPFKQLRDYYVTNTKPWNIAIDPSTLKYQGAGGQMLNDPIFEHGAPPNKMTVDGCEVKWDLYMDSTPNWAPSKADCVQERKTYTLIPYGAAKIHMSDLPTIKF